MKLKKRTWTKKIRPIRIDGDVAYSPLTQGYSAVIDAADVPLVEGLNWCAVKADSGLVYAYNGGNVKKRLHQFLTGAAPGVFHDHRDGDGLNNRRANIRVATARQNSQNVRPKVPMKGVGKHGSGWRARITVDGRRIGLGLFATEAEAGVAYDEAAKMHFGEFARLNFPAEGGPAGVCHDTPAGPAGGGRPAPNRRPTPTIARRKVQGAEQA
jgi:hypothetical protein